MPPLPPPPPQPPAPAAKRQHAKITFVNGMDRSQGGEWVTQAGAMRVRRRMGRAGSVLTCAALPEGAAGGRGSRVGAGKEEEETRTRCGNGAPRHSPGYLPDKGFGVDEWHIWPMSKGGQPGAGRAVMDLSGVAGKDSVNEQEQRAADAWEAGR
ncbi:hypothetical protein JCM8097_002740 [Rhodosporidiobolus ruineniae]